MKKGNNKLNNIKLNTMIDKRKPVVVAVSTGVDSMSLFHFLYHNGYTVVVAHVNHKKRKESDNEYLYLKNLCLSLGVPFEGYILNKKIESNFQEVARYERYNFLKSVADKYNTNQIVLAHHLDDEAETVLMRLTRGSFLKGYAGMKDVTVDSSYTIIRPFLYLSKDEIIEYAKDNNIKYFEDSSNNEDCYTRNIFRHNVIPTLKGVNPSFLDAIKNFQEDYYDIYEHIEKEVDEFFNLYSVVDNEKISISRENFNKQDNIIKKGIILRSINLISSNSLLAKHERMSEIIKLSLTAKETRTVEVGKDYSLYVEKDNLVFVKNKEVKKINLQIDDFGEYKVDDNLRVIISQNYHTLPEKNSYMLCYNNTKEVFPITIRNREVGDFVKVNGITKKVSDLLVEHKIPRRLRDEILVVLNDSGIFFIPNIIRKETDKTLKNTLYITVEVTNDSR